MALIGSTMLRLNRLARNASRSSWTRFSRAASIAKVTGWADPSSYSLSTGATSSSQRSGAFRVSDADLGVLVSTPHNAVAADVVEEEEPKAERLVTDLEFQTKNPRGIEPPE